MEIRGFWTSFFTIAMLIKGSYAPIKPLSAMKPFGVRSFSTFSRSMFAIHNDLKDELRGSWPKPIKEGGACAQDLQCLSLRTHTECKKGKCQCVAGHKPYQEMCVHEEFFTGWERSIIKRQSFQKTPNCTNDQQCQMDLYSSRCVNARCDCGVAGKGTNGICKKGDFPKTLYSNEMFTKPWLHLLQYQTRMPDLLSATTILILPPTVISIRLANYDQSNNFDPSTVKEFLEKKISYK
uniref:EB domain-containing protein n=1 Tax=Romanomermis culicivorax TaxID=13658 RepID=A0A915IBB1_ROMCU